MLIKDTLERWEFKTKKWERKKREKEEGEMAHSCLGQAGRKEWRTERAQDARQTNERIGESILRINLFLVEDATVEYVREVLTTLIFSIQGVSTEATARVKTSSCSNWSRPRRTQNQSSSSIYLFCHPPARELLILICIKICWGSYCRAIKISRRTRGLALA